MRFWWFGVAALLGSGCSLLANLDDVVAGGGDAGAEASTVIDSQADATSSAMDSGVTLDGTANVNPGDAGYCALHAAATYCVDFDRGLAEDLGILSVTRGSSAPDMTSPVSAPSAFRFSTDQAFGYAEAVRKKDLLNQSTKLVKMEASIRVNSSFVMETGSGLDSVDVMLTAAGGASVIAFWTIDDVGALWVSRPRPVRR
jgi:hypothetical protein